MVQRLDEILQEMSAENQFMTLVFADIDTEQGEMRYVNAGHHYPLHYRARTRKFEEQSSTGLPFGLLPHAREKVRTTSLDPGDLLVLYSDGFVEACNEKDEEFDVDRLTGIVEVNRESPAEMIVQ